MKNPTIKDEVYQEIESELIRLTQAQRIEWRRHTPRSYDLNLKGVNFRVCKRFSDDEDYTEPIFTLIISQYDKTVLEVQTPKLWNVVENITRPGPEVKILEMLKELQ